MDDAIASIVSFALDQGGLWAVLCLVLAWALWQREKSHEARHKASDDRIDTLHRERTQDALDMAAKMHSATSTLQQAMDLLKGRS